MKVRIDADKCEGHMACVRLCPEVFLVDADGYSFTDASQSVAPAYEELVRKAAQACPVMAIVISEE